MEWLVEHDAEICVGRLNSTPPYRILFHSKHSKWIKCYLTWTICAFHMNYYFANEKTKKQRPNLIRNIVYYAVTVKASIRWHIVIVRVLAGTYFDVCERTVINCQSNKLMNTLLRIRVESTLFQWLTLSILTTAARAYCSIAYVVLFLSGCLLVIQ